MRTGSENIPSKLEQRLEYLEENRRHTFQALEMALSLGDFSDHIKSEHNLERLIAETEKRIQGAVPFDATAIFLVDENSSDFHLNSCNPPEIGPEIEAEIEAMIEKGLFSWALREQRGLPVFSADYRRQYFLHVITTSSRVKGMFIGLLPPKLNEIADGSLTILSIILKNMAFLLESREFYSLLQQRNKRLSAEIESKSAELIRSEKRLQQALKMQAIGTLAGGIAHDINNILFPIIGYTEMAIDDVPPHSLTAKNLQEVIRASQRARDLVKQILTFSRKNDNVFKPVRIQEILRETVELLRATLPATIDIEVAVDDYDGAVMGDPTAIHQVIMNLGTNAYHAMMEKGGLLKIELSQVHYDRPSSQEKVDLKAGRYAKLCVHDTGHGIDDAILEQIFDPYFTTKTKSKGTGLGLAVTHGIVANHGGTIKVSSQPGHGSLFEVFFPLDETVPDSAIDNLVDTIPGGDERILLVDDEANIVDMAQQLLTRLGYKVSAYQDSQKALKSFRADPYQYDLVISDMTMPFMTGDRMAQAMLELRPDFPIILCTGYHENINSDYVQSIGIRKLVMKPLQKTEMAFIIREVLDN